MSSDCDFTKKVNTTFAGYRKPKFNIRDFSEFQLFAKKNIQIQQTQKRKQQATILASGQTDKGNAEFHNFIPL